MSKLLKAQSKTGRNERIAELERKDNDTAKEHGLRVDRKPDIIKKRRKKVTGKDSVTKGRAGPDSDSSKRKRRGKSNKA